MAEWTNRPHELDSSLSTEIREIDQARNETPRAPVTPGATTSPQHPGEVPDRSTVPGAFTTRVARATSVRRPLTEYGTAQALMNVYAVPPDEAMDPSRFEQATASYEEMRKAYPAQLPPVRPAPGYALSHGDDMASELQAIDGPRPTPPEPSTATGEAYQAQPGGTDAPAARTDASAAKVGSAFSPSDAPASVRAPSDAKAGADEMAEGGQIGESRWAEASPAPGDVASAAGTLPAAKQGETTGQGETGKPPPVASQ